MLLEGSEPRQIALALAKKHKLSKALVPAIVKSKSEFYKSRNNFKIFPKAAALIKLLSHKIPMAIVSGALAKRFYNISKKFVK